MEIARPIYAVPGEVTSALSDGTNDLLRQRQAAAITSARDVLGSLRVGGQAQFRGTWLAFTRTRLPPSRRIPHWFGYRRARTRRLRPDR